MRCHCFLALDFASHLHAKESPICASSPGLEDSDKREQPFQPKIPLTSRGSTEENNAKISAVAIHSLQEHIDAAEKGSKAMKKDDEELAMKKTQTAAWLLNITARMFQSVS